MIFGTCDTSSPSFYFDLFPLSSGDWGLVIYRGARFSCCVKEVAETEESAINMANKWLQCMEGKGSFVVVKEANPFFDRIENIPARDRPHTPLGMVWENLSKGYPTKFSTSKDELEWEWKLRGIVAQTASDANYEYQRTQDGTIIWQRRKTANSCFRCESTQIFLTSDISDREEEEFQYVCRCGVSSARATSKLEALEEWNMLKEYALKASN